MAKFEIGDKVRGPHEPGVVEVMKVFECDAEICGLGGELFEFLIPETGEVDCMHTSEFEKV